MKVWIKVFGLGALRRFRGSKIRDWKIQLSFFRASKTKFFSRGGEKERDEQLAIFTTSVEC